MIGLILCGGQSTRMGSDKGLLLHQTNSWAQMAADKLLALQIPVHFSVNYQQLDTYANIVSPVLFITDNDSLNIKGPLLGVLSAHVKCKNEDLFILACDLPLMDMTILKQLLDNYNQQQHFDAYIFTNNNEPEPLCGIYTASGLAKINTLYSNGELKKFSMKFILSQLAVCTLPIKEDELKYFQNFNAHAILNGL
jgi:molybdopterin-guanine dinucleotide biosynthesis protein A